MPIKSVSVYTANGESGRCRLGSGGDSSELEVATILVAGQMAEKCALGHREAFNWFDDDVDTVNAIAMVDALVEDGGFDGDVHEARRWVEVRARSLLVTKWRAVEAIAERLQKRTVLSGDEIVDICRREGVRRQGEPTKEKRTAPTAQDLRAEVAEIDRQIAKIKAQLNQPDDDPALWPLRRRLLDLHRKRRELLAQLEGGTHR
jgi:hypothetical protein